MAGKLLPSVNLELFAWAVCFPITDHALFSWELFFYPSKNYLFIYTRLFENLKARILITWSVMGQQTTQSIKVYCNIRNLSAHISQHVKWRLCQPSLVGDTEEITTRKSLVLNLWSFTALAKRTHKQLQMAAS